MADAVKLVTNRLKVNQVIGENSSQTVIKEKFTVPETKPDIERILSVDRRAKLTNVEVITDKVVVEGFIFMDIVYVAREADQSVHHMHQKLAFAHFVDVPGAKPDNVAQIKVTVEDLSWNVDPRECRVFDITIILDIFAKVTETQQVDVLTEPPPGTTAKTQKLKVQHVIGENESEVIVSDRFKVPLAKPDIDKILDLDAKITISKKRVIKDKVLVDGIIDLHVSYVALEPTQSVHHMKHKISFTHFVDVPGALPDNNVDITVKVEHLDSVVLTPRSLEAEVVLGIFAKVTETRQLDVLTDLIGQVANVEKRRLKVEQVIGEDSTQLIVKENKLVPPTKPNMEKILDINLQEVCITDQDVINDKVIVTGSLEFQIMYVADLPDQPVHHMEQKMRFKHFVQVPGAKPGMNVEIIPTVEHIQSTILESGIIETIVPQIHDIFHEQHEDEWDHDHDHGHHGDHGDHDAKKHGHDHQHLVEKFEGRVLKLEAVLKLFAKVTETIQLEVITRVSLIQPTPSPTVAPTIRPTVAPTQRPGCPPGTIEIRHVVQPGDTLSKLAQAFNTTVEQTLEVNPQITNPDRIDVGQVILICALPRPKG